MAQLIKKLIQSSIKKDYDCVIAVAGRRGRGKTYVAMSIALSVDPTFDIDRICFTQEKFFELINKRDENGEFVLQKGNVIVYEEAGVSVDARAFWLNREISHLIETFRNRNLIVIFTLPSLAMLDKNVRRSLNLYIFVDKKQPTNKMNRTKVKIVEINRNPFATSDYLMIYPKYKGRKIVYVWFYRPPAPLCNRYEKYANPIKHQISLTAENNLKKAKEKKDNATGVETFDPEPYVKKVLDNYKEYKGKRIKIDSNKIRFKQNLPRDKANYVRDVALKRMEEG